VRLSALLPQPIAEKPASGGLSQFGSRLYAPDFPDRGAKWPKVSSHSLNYSRFPETPAGDRVRSVLRGRASSAIRQNASLIWRQVWQCRVNTGRAEHAVKIAKLPALPSANWKSGPPEPFRSKTASLYSPVEQ